MNYLFHLDSPALGEVGLNYVTAGEGAAVALPHGWPQIWCIWCGRRPDTIVTSDRGALH